MDKLNNNLQSVMADVTMVKFDSTLKVTDITEGNINYVRETRKQKLLMRLDWSRENGKSVEKSMSVRGDKYEIYNAGIKQVIIGKIDKKANIKKEPKMEDIIGFFNMSKAQRTANFSPAYLGEEEIRGGTKTWHIQIKPKTTANYKLAELWVDVDGMPRQTKITAQNNDTTTVLLSNIQTNITMKGSIFKLNYDSKKVKKVQS